MPGTIVVLNEELMQLYHGSPEAGGNARARVEGVQLAKRDTSDRVVLDHCFDIVETEHGAEEKPSTSVWSHPPKGLLTSAASSASNTSGSS